MANAQAAVRMIAAPQLDLAELRETLADIVSDDRRAGEVLRRLRALLTKEAPESKPLDVKSTLEEMLQLVRSDVVMRRIMLEVDFAPDLPAVCGDRVQLQQVALNLLFNAFEAVQDIDLAAARRPADRSPGRHVVTASRSGRGVPRQMARVFEPFYRPADGLGLGLPICQTNRRLPWRRARRGAQRHVWYSFSCGSPSAAVARSPRGCRRRARPDALPRYRRSLTGGAQGWTLDAAGHVGLGCACFEELLARARQVHDGTMTPRT